MTAIWGIDVSSYNPLSQVESALKSGVGFVIVKATEGLGYINPLYSQQVALTRKYGARVGHYHFAHPANGGVAEAKYFLAHADIRPGEATMLDLESGTTTWAQDAAYASGWLTMVNATKDCHALLYENVYWMNGVHNAASGAQRQIIDAAPLVIAAPGTAGKPGISRQWAIHQYSTAGGLDHDLLVAAWASFAVPVSKPAPVPTPVPVNATRRFAMLVFALGSDYVFATAFRRGVVTQDVTEAKAAIARGEVVKVLGGPAATALGLSAGQHGNTQVIIGQTFHDTAVAAAGLMS